MSNDSAKHIFSRINRLLFLTRHYKPLGNGGERVTICLMGNSKGRDNAKKRRARRKKTERLALAKKKQKATK